MGKKKYSCIEMQYFMKKYSNHEARQFRFFATNNLNIIAVYIKICISLHYAKPLNYLENHTNISFEFERKKMNLGDVSVMILWWLTCQITILQF